MEIIRPTKSISSSTKTVGQSFQVTFILAHKRFHRVCNSSLFWSLSWDITSLAAKTSALISSVLSHSQEVYLGRSDFI